MIRRLAAGALTVLAALALAGCSNPEHDARVERVEGAVTTILQSAGLDDAVQSALRCAQLSPDRYECVVGVELTSDDLETLTAFAEIEPDLTRAFRDEFPSSQDEQYSPLRIDLHTRGTVIHAETIDPPLIDALLNASEVPPIDVRLDPAIASVEMPTSEPVDALCEVAVGYQAAIADDRIILASAVGPGRVEIRLEKGFDRTASFDAACTLIDTFRRSHPEATLKLSGNGYASTLQLTGTDEAGVDDFLDLWGDGIADVRLSGQPITEG